MISDFSKIKEKIVSSRPLIHSITSPVAINDCANAVLALGAQPIMAEHPKEVAAITATAKALTVSLANITDARMESMLISGRRAYELGIPSLIDLVGVSCSPLRLELARKFIAECHPAVIKGNFTEIRACLGASFDAASGTDVSARDAAATDEMQELLKAFAAEHHTVIMATGAVDLISDGAAFVRVANGHPLMSRVTGTGCILSCVVGTYLAACEPLKAAVLGTLNWDISGERAVELVRCSYITQGGDLSAAGGDLSAAGGAKAVGLGSYHAALLDALSLLSGEELVKAAKIEL